MIRLIKSTFYNEKETKKKLVSFISKANQLSFGSECQKFEDKFAKYQGRKYCVFVNSGSSANLALIQAMLNLGKIKKGENVGFSSLTWSTNAMPLIQLGLKPIPIDVELDTLNVSSRKLLEVIKKQKLKILFLTNLLGFCDDIDEIKKICDKKEMVLLEDNCESLGTVYKGKKLGNFGLASTFSFYVGHHMSTIEGGAICTDDQSLANMLKLVRAHGWDRNLSFESQTKIRNKHKVNSTFYSRYTFYDLGYNLRPTEINGFIGNTQIKYLPEILKKRNKNFLKIASTIYGNKNFYPIKYNHIDFVSNFAVPVICKTQKIRDELVEKCNDKIEIRPIVGGDMTKQPFFSKYAKKLNFNNPNASLIHAQGLYFGNNPELTKKELADIEIIFTK
ncbi:MAG: DegT/DnrJ/EryC1/StrS aminotransferase [Candidatus Levybacteria bacterium CG_4_10_14_0_8_um_filter_35_23]|nr:MAG: DegT/DnrJ/EryC1/StrS aminotransferase [Candidatus Levybacteria bacterium CG_4_10_14_0_8_um_filter_35_23]